MAKRPRYFTGGPALEGVRDATFTGFLPAEHVFRLAAMARRHGFTLAEYKTHATMGAPKGGAIRV